MSELAVENILRATESIDTPRPRRLGLFAAWVLSIFVAVMPRWSAERWQRIAVWRAAIVAAVNVAAMGAWMLALLTAYKLHENSELRNATNGQWSTRIAYTIRKVWMTNWMDVKAIFGRGAFTGTMSVLSLIFVVILFLGLAFFVLVPFAARPGKNRACLKHVTRAALLGTGLGHIWMAALVGTFALMIICRLRPEGPWLVVVLAVVILLALWSLWAMIRAVRVDYRRPEDLPAPVPARCDVCGYDLHLAEMNAKCPECGKPVVESLSAEFRPQTQWEREPGLGAMVRQLREIIVRPQNLFSHMPTKTGQASAQRWMLLWMLVVALIAVWIVPALVWQLKYGWVAMRAPVWARTAPEDIPMSTETYFLMGLGGVTLAILWAVFGMMMVGVETVGVVALAHFRKHYVPLSASAKVTCYASPLMMVWALAGGFHILLLIVAYQHAWFRVHPLAEQISLVASTAIAHIGGLLWFEWTVYRGLKGIQFANH